MTHFTNDYSYLAHPRILEALNKYQNQDNIAYGLDVHSKNASRMIKEIFNSKDGEVHFLCGGTQTNMVFITSILRHYEGVISCDTGHINVHESACIEGQGIKIITVKNINGKLYPEHIKQVMSVYNNEHMVKPKMVYISNSTETGTIYSKQELLDLSKTCKEYNLYFYIDGARLGSALTSKENDVPYSLLGEICDAFYIGGTKNGCLFGEALVINNPLLQKDFRYHIKNKGAMLSKGFAVSIQFEEMFKDNLYFDLARHTNEMADLLKEVLMKHGLKVLPSPTNQIFVTLKKDKARKLIEEFELELWEENEEEMTVRFVTSFMNKKEDIDEVSQYLEDNS